MKNARDGDGDSIYYLSIFPFLHSLYLFLSLSFPLAGAQRAKEAAEKYRE